VVPRGRRPLLDHAGQPSRFLEMFLRIRRPLSGLGRRRLRNPHRLPEAGHSAFLFGQSLACFGQLPGPFVESRLRLLELGGEMPECQIKSATMRIIAHSRQRSWLRS
jgi:hypothetical protein